MPKIIRRDHLTKKPLKKDDSLPLVLSPVQGAPWFLRHQKQKARSFGTERVNLQPEVYPVHPNKEIMPLNSKSTSNLVHVVRCTPVIRRLVKDIVPSIHRNIHGYRGCCLPCKGLFEGCDQGGMGDNRLEK